MEIGFYRKNQYRSGFALITIILILGVLLLVGATFFTLVTLERRISLSQGSAFETYYLAEAGINEAVYKLRNDSDWRQEFEDGNISRTLTRDSGLASGGAYEVQIEATDPGRADIISIGKLTLTGATAQRIVKTKVVRAVNPSPLAGMATYSDVDTNINMSVVNITGGDMFANDDLDLFAWSGANIDGQALTADEIHLYSWSNLNATEGCGAVNCPVVGCSPCAAPPDHVAMPMLDFDSDDPNSYKSRAGAVYTEDEFRTLLDNNNPLVLNSDVNYVEGDVRLKRGDSLVLNGILVADGNIIYGDTGGARSEPIHLEVNNTPGKGSGFIAKGSVEILGRPFSGDVNIEGVLYAMDGVRIQNLSFTGEVNITGSIIGREVDFLNFWSDMNITYNDEILNKSLFGPPTDSPVVTIEHWEEEY
ncbi:MAG: hypothetical protein PHW01_02160 [Patescibacteria group bacterium]|nr:hypothetical protein [Patescibacteria group bacterium]